MPKIISSVYSQKIKIKNSFNHALTMIIITKKQIHTHWIPVKQKQKKNYQILLHTQPHKTLMILNGCGSKSVTKNIKNRKISVTNIQKTLHAQSPHICFMYSMVTLGFRSQETISAYICCHVIGISLRFSNQPFHLYTQLNTYLDQASEFLK